MAAHSGTNCRLHQSLAKSISGPNYIDIRKDVILQVEAKSRVQELEIEMTALKAELEPVADAPLISLPQDGWHVHCLDWHSVLRKNVFRMSDHSSLSKDEREFIQQLLINPVLGKPLQAPRFRVDGGEQANALLARLADHSQLSLESHFDDHWISFPLQLIEDEFHTLHLQLGAPCIFENGPVQRPWRLHLKQAIALQDETGATSDLTVRELSPNGMLISNPGKAPLHFTLWLPLPGQEPIPLRGKRVRSVGKKLTAYKLKGCHPGHTERIRHFLFQQHRLKHPQLRSQA